MTSYCNNRFLSALYGVLILCWLAGLSEAGAIEASDFVRTPHSAVRLVSGGAQEGEYLAAVEFVLEEGFKTYWRTPGDSGLPPVFDWTGSNNLGPVEMFWPAPIRFSDGVGISWGYRNSILLLLKIRPKNPNLPVKLMLKLDYGICRDLCIPLQAKMEHQLAIQSSQRDRLLTSLSFVPKTRIFGILEPLSLRRAEPLVGKAGWRFHASAPASDQPQLFAEGPEGWLLSVSEARIDASRNDVSFDVMVEEKPKRSEGRVELRLTLVTKREAIEAKIGLDAEPVAR